MPAPWHVATTTGADRWALVRQLIERVILSRREASEVAEVVVRWRGGSESRHVVHQGLRRYDQLGDYAGSEARVRALRGGLDWRADRRGPKPGGLSSDERRRLHRQPGPEAVRAPGAGRCPGRRRRPGRSDLRARAMAAGPSGGVRRQPVRRPPVALVGEAACPLTGRRERAMDRVGGRGRGEEAATHARTRSTTGGRTLPSNWRSRRPEQRSVGGQAAEKRTRGVIPDVRTIKENLLWVRAFATVAELVEALREFKRTGNERWLIGRHGHRTPSQVRRDLASSNSAAA